MSTHEDYRERRSRGFVWGFLLIALGMTFLLMTFHFLPESWLHTWWPLVVIFLGFGSLFTASGPRRLGSAVTTIGIGMWLLVATNDWYGLTFSRSWPLALVAAGLGTLVRAFAARVWWREEDDHA